MEYPVAFTQTCPNSNLSYKEQFELYWPELKSALDLIGNYEVYPELTLNGVLHFHGKLRVNNEEAYYRQKLRLKKKLGFNLFKMIDNVPKWDEYIQKKKVLMNKIYPKEVLPLTDTIKIDPVIQRGYYGEYKKCELCPHEKTKLDGTEAISPLKL